ncbi:MAG: hypothetical protein ACPG7F_13080, partial [Aggregatilineales bacterium]
SFRKNKNVIAFDICPVNIVLNEFTRTLGLEYDDGGKISASGNVNFQRNEIKRVVFLEAVSGFVMDAHGIVFVIHSVIIARI